MPGTGSVAHLRENLAAERITPMGRHCEILTASAADRREAQVFG